MSATTGRKEGRKGVPADLILCVALLFASCANAVNNHGGAVGSGGGGSASAASSSSASSSSSGQAAAAGTSGTAPDIVLGADAVSYPVDDSGRIDYAAVSGSSVSQGSGKGYISITPSLPDPLYQETQSTLYATWTAYDVTLTLDGTPIVVPTISKGDSTAIVIENVPTGARVEAQATITVESTSAAAGLGYTTLSAAASATIQEGSNTITMYAQYPLSCEIDPYFADAAGSYSSSVSSYRNVPGSATALTPPPAELELDGLPYAFAGWSLRTRAQMPEGQEPPVVLTGNSIPYRAFQGKVQLYAQYTISLESVKVKYVFSQSGTDYLPAANKVKEKATDTTGYDSGKEFTVSVADIQAGTAKVAVLSCPGYTYMDGTEEKVKVFAGWSLPGSDPDTVDFSAGSSPAALTMAALAERDSTTDTLELTAVFLDATDAEKADIWKEIEYDDTVYAARSTYHVCTAQQLNFLCGKMIDSAKTVLLEDDISLAGTTNKFFSHNFYGTLNGQNHTVTIEDPSDDYQGLMAYIDSRGIVKNLTVEGSIASGGQFQGGIAGTNEGLIENCTSRVRIAATPGSANRTGGIAGNLSGGTIRNCTFSGEITGGAEYIGGIAGNLVGGTIHNCTFSGSITATGYAGGSARAGKIMGNGNPIRCSNNIGGGTLTISGSDGSDVREYSGGYDP